MMKNVWGGLQRWFLLSVLLAAVFSVVPVGVFAQDYPSKPIRMVVPYPAGAGVDAYCRMVAQRLSAQLGQLVVVENRTGANGVIGIESVVKSAADGYTLLFSPGSPISASPHIYPVNFDVRKDLDPVALLATAGYVLVGHASVPFQNLGELIGYAKSNPEKLTFGSAGSGSQAHLNLELLKRAAGIDVLHVPYQGGAPASIAVLGGQVQFYFETLQNGLPNIRAGKLKAFGMTTTQRSAFLPDVPPLADTLKSFDTVMSNSWYGVFAPAGTPDALLRRLNSELHKAANDRDLQRRLPDGGFVAAPTTTPAEFRNFVRADYERFGKLIASLGIKAQ